jgi:hypothetical protein
MTECTEVSYVVPSYFFCAVGDKARKGLVAEKYGRENPATL